MVPRRAAEKGSLHAALAQLAEQDPLINLRQDDLRQELSVSLYGEVQKEVIGATLANDYGLEVGFRETTMICVERPAGIGDAVEAIGKGQSLPRHGRSPRRAGDDRHRHHVPARRVAGYLAALRLRLRGCVPLGDGGHRPGHPSRRPPGVAGDRLRGDDDALRLPAAGNGRQDFRYLTPLVLMSALQRAGTTVCEPVHRFHLEIPSDTFGAVSQVLARLEAPLHGITTQATSSQLEGDIAAAKVHELQLLLPGLTRGEGVLTSTFDHYQPIRGETPTRPRTDRDPRNRGEYLRQVLPRLRLDSPTASARPIGG